MNDLGLVNENKLGITEGHEEIKKAIDGQFRGETGEIGLYLAMAKMAQREGYPEIGEVLKRIAWEEADHAARYAELNGKISCLTKDNLEQMFKGEIGANKYKTDLAAKCKDADLCEVQDFINEAAKDEARHAQMLKGMLDRYFS
ncbi:ferritin-like domain-containing protein [Oceanirhabdus seepicola]|uniref:Rubrerythrin family protein n=1 Tax=Oceanirhabdus seepicola TaxID=2828781 RepID=A0A9J6NYG0_9CLOT|nr:ferritin family protein [Oceanirhabdus seepicola]MCM1989559.1 rubrerythrin family protein [Oceanirhabdus seepicola]